MNLNNTLNNLTVDIDSELAQQLDQINLFTEDSKGSIQTVIEPNANLNFISADADQFSLTETSEETESKINIIIPPGHFRSELNLVAAVANSNDLVVNTTDDQNDGSSANGLSLRDAILIANQNPSRNYTIILEPGKTYTLDIDGKEEYNGKTGDLNLYKGNNVTIKAAGGDENATITAKGMTEKDRVFYVVKGSTLNLENITVADGSVSSFDKGGNIYLGSDSTLNLNDVVIEGGFAGDGGGMYVLDGTVTLNDTVFKDNRALNGGGIKLEKNSLSKNLSLTAINSEISNNAATSANGGGIYNIGGEVVISNSRVSDNTSRAGGAGIYTQGLFENLATGAASLTITNSELSGNEIRDAKDGGGAIYSNQSTRIAISDSVFTKNIVETKNSSGSNKIVKGGAIQVQEDSILSISGSNFSGNQALDPKNKGRAYGGAVASSNSQVNIIQSIFEENGADGSGGALELESGENYENIIEDSQFTGNFAGTFGGAISVNGITTVKNSQFSGNSAVTYGGAGFVNGKSTWSGAKVSNNTVTGDGVFGHGGGLHFADDEHQLTDVTIENNQANRYGGGVSFSGVGTEVTFTNSKIEGNQAKEAGGGFFGDDYATINFDENEILYNSVTNTDAGGGGGAIVGSSIANITRSTIAGNQAEFGAGGGIFNFDNNNNGQVTIVDTNIIDNRAKVGGALFAKNGSKFEIDRTLVANNHAIEGGGLSVGAGGVADIDNSTFSGNSAQGNGSAVYVGKQEWVYPPGEVYLSSSTVTDNTADSNNDGSGEGAFYVYPYDEGDIPPAEGGKFYSNNSIVAGNFDTPNNAGPNADTPDISGEIADGSNNIIGDSYAGAEAHRTGSSGLTNGVDGNQISTSNNPLDPGLEPLADNGGPTQTHALANGSIAINTGNNSLVDSDSDQRGSGFDRIVNGTVDVGAYERQLDLRSITGNDVLTGNGDLNNGHNCLTEDRHITNSKTNIHQYNYDSLDLFGSEVDQKDIIETNSLVPLGLCHGFRINDESNVFGGQNLIANNYNILESSIDIGDRLVTEANYI